MVKVISVRSFVETLRKFIIAKLSIRIIVSIISTDEDPSSQIESFTMINLRVVSTKQNW